VAYCVPVEGRELSAAPLRDWLRRSLPEYMVPSSMVFLEILPLTPNGKVDRRALPAPDGGRPELREEYVAPRTQVEELIAGVWSEVLGIERVGIHDNFFDLGGHSLQVAKVVNRLRVIGIDTTAGQLFRYRSVEGMAQAASVQIKKNTPLTLELNLGGAKSESKTIYCIHPSGGSVRSYMPLAERLGEDFRVVGIQAAGLEQDESPLGSLELIARRYWEEICRVQADGPYVIVGWSYGGIVAQEMCRQRPEATKGVILIEPPMLEGGVKNRFRIAADEYRMCQRLWLFGQNTKTWHRARIEERLRELAGNLEVPVDSVSLDKWFPYNTLGLLLESLLEHNLMPSEGGATLFVSDEVRNASSGSDLSTGVYEDYLRYWSAVLSGGLRVVDVPGRHMEMLSPGPQLESLVEEVRRFF
ncbi:alpha/beta fold hydrolase, partial [Streptomyces sp. NPDC021218]|uniref:alpha/beta fold hydrolase n=1 Tax=Streptomyces sp. NPDC021218 TaxID=3365119 RepID=UPI0037907580